MDFAGFAIDCMVRESRALRGIVLAGPFRLGVEGQPEVGQQAEEEQLLEHLET